MPHSNAGKPSSGVCSADIHYNQSAISASDFCTKLQLRLFQQDQLLSTSECKRNDESSSLLATFSRVLTHLNPPNF